MDRQEREELTSRLQHDAWRIASHFGLRYKAIVAESPRVKSRYGVCYEDGLIKIRLQHSRIGRALKYSSLVDTLCHELAHLRYFNHGPEFKTFYLQILSWARKQGIYRPAPRRPRAPAAPTAHDPAATSLPRRNGVPVFPSAEPSGLTLDLPWERSTSAPTATPTPAASKPSPTRRKPRKDQRQLSLF
jgi:hypothetical protein